MSFFKSIFKSKKSTTEKKYNHFISFLAKVSPFENLSKRQRKYLDDFIHTRKFSSGEVVFKKDYPNIVMYIVMEGHLSAYLDKEHTESVKEIKKYDYFGECGLFVDDSRSATIVAAEDSILLAISKRDMKNFIHEHSKAGSKILFNLGKILTKHLIKSNQTLLDKQSDIEDLEGKQDKLLSKIEKLKEELDNMRE